MFRQLTRKVSSMLNTVANHQNDPIDLTVPENACHAIKCFWKIKMRSPFSGSKFDPRDPQYPALYSRFSQELDELIRNTSVTNKTKTKCSFLCDSHTQNTTHNTQRTTPHIISHSSTPFRHHFIKHKTQYTTTPHIISQQHQNVAATQTTALFHRCFVSCTRSATHPTNQTPSPPRPPLVQTWHSRPSPSWTKTATNRSLSRLPPPLPHSSPRPHLYLCLCPRPRLPRPLFLFNTSPRNQSHPRFRCNKTASRNPKPLLPPLFLFPTLNTFFRPPCRHLPPTRSLFRRLLHR